jgi:hypothetical protein
MADNIQGEAWHNEMRRKSQDMIRVKNPTDKDYTLVWDEGGASARFTVPSEHKDIGWGPGQRVMQRYLARKFTKEIVDKMLLHKQDEKLTQLKDKLEKQGATDVAYNANMQLMSESRLRSDLPSVREPLEDEVWMGTEEEFGVDTDSVPIVEEKPQINKDPFERLDGKRYQKSVEEPYKGNVAPGITTPEPFPPMPKRVYGKPALKKTEEIA